MATPTVADSVTATLAVEVSEPRINPNVTSFLKWYLEIVTTLSRKSGTGPNPPVEANFNANPKNPLVGSAPRRTSNFPFFVCSNCVIRFVK
jgi:hypothetical protein